MTAPIPVSWLLLVPGVEHRGERATVMRYKTPAAVIVPGQLAQVGAVSSCG
jgi:hypothetical protein